MHALCSKHLELSKAQKESIKSSKRISNPGCYPTGFIGLIRPLVDTGIIGADVPLTVNAISGYSGGGKGLIEIYEGGNHEPWGAYGYSMVRTLKTGHVSHFLMKRQRFLISLRARINPWSMLFKES